MAARSFPRLPHSGTELDVPLIGTHPAAPARYAFVEPDRPVALTVDDVRMGGDTDLQRVIGLLTTESARRDHELIGRSRITNAPPLLPYVFSGR